MQYPEQQVDEHRHQNSSINNTATTTTQSTSHPLPLATPTSNPYVSDYRVANTITGGTPVSYQADLSYDQKSGNNVGSDTTPAPTTRTRKPSLADTVIIGAVTAASSAVTAATTVVEIARRLVVSDDDNDLATPKDKIKGSSSKGVLPSLLKTPADHNGLEFSQRRLSKDRTKKPVLNYGGNGSIGVQTHADGNNFATVGTVSDNRVSARDEDFGAGVNTIASAAKDSTAPSDVNNQTPADPTIQLADNTTQLQGGDIHVVDGGGSSTNSNNGTNGMQSERNTAAAALPSLNTMYVAGQGPDSAGQGAMSVDQPAVSQTNPSKSTHTGMSVDTPDLVGQPRDPKAHRIGGLQVDRKGSPPYSEHEIHAPHYDQIPGTSKEGDLSHDGSIQTSKDNSRVIHGNYHHLDQRSSANAASAINRNPYEAHMSHHRGSVASGLGVDYPVIPTAILAGSGSSDNTNRNRPQGIYNSAINVDKAGASDRKSSGMGVDEPATVTHQMARVQNPLSRPGKSKTGAVATPSTETDIKEKYTDDVDYPEDDRESLIDRVKGVFRRHSSGMKEPRDGQMMASPNTSHRSSSTMSSYLPPVIPDGYNGPIPQVAPGQEIIWVKKTTRTDYYDANEEGSDPPEHGPYQGSNRNSSSSLFLNRLRSRNSTSADKGKRRM
ncbi:hypothetical protein BG011_007408 [Mortierella polycephala]|uniref:Uncharacterized protein n=1 Tax=Mortierella polycephala TaxID=41804 RepID=A0A9P6QCK1_9FUNG|nr:hypothetical protein BG011_007408 [Mortierella polycephala]